jgi:dihydropteroate synthase
MPEHSPAANLRIWEFGTRNLQLGGCPLLMGIVNVTPDSFSDGGQFLNAEAATRHALQLVEEGADVLDIGGESTRPGSTPVSLEDELERVIPVVQGVARRTDVPISIDTYKAEVARRALDAGAAIVNDISGLAYDSRMRSVCREYDAGVILMHMQGTPQTMQHAPRYEDVVSEICRYFLERLKQLEGDGLRRERLVVDPGIGFGKTAEHNLAILSSVARFRELGRPVLIGHSRKRFLGKLLGRPLDERLFGTLGITLSLALQSIDIIRVHEVAANRDALLAWRAVVERCREAMPSCRP